MNFAFALIHHYVNNRLKNSSFQEINYIDLKLKKAQIYLQFTDTQSSFGNLPKKLSFKN